MFSAYQYQCSCITGLFLKRAKLVFSAREESNVRFGQDASTAGGYETGTLKSITAVGSNNLYNIKVAKSSNFSQAEKMYENLKLMSPQVDFAKQIADLSCRVKKLQIKLELQK